MSKLKSVISGLTAFCLMCTSCTSCNREKNNSDSSQTNISSDINQDSGKNKKAGAQLISRYFDEKELSLNYSPLESSDIVSADDSSFYMFTSQDKTPSEYKTKTFSLPQGNDISEQSYKLPEDYNIRCETLRTSDSILWVGGRADNNKVTNTLHCTDIKTGADKSTEFDSKMGVNAIHTDADKNIYVVSYKAISVFSPDLTLTKTIDISKLIYDTGCKITMVYASCVSSDGNIFLGCWNKGNDTYCIYKLTKDEKISNLTDIISDMQGSPQLMFASDDGSVTMCTGYDHLMINKYDISSGDTILRYELGSVQDLYGPGCGYDMIYRSTDGIFGYNYENDESDMIISQDQYTGDNTEFYSMAIQGDNAYITSAVYGDIANHLIHSDSDGNIMDDYKLPEFSDDYISPCMYIDSDSTVYYLITNYGILDNDDGYACETSSYTVYKVDDSGESIKVFETPDVEVDYTPEAFAVDKNGNFIMPAMDSDYSYSLSVYSPDGTSMGSIPAPDDRFYAAYMYTGIDGCLYAASYQKIYKVDTENMKISEVPDVSINAASYFNGGSGYDFYYSTDCGIFGYNMSQNKTDEIMLWTDTDYDCTPQQTAVISPECIIVSGYNYDDEAGLESSTLKCLDKADQARLDELNSRNVITLAGSDLLNSQVGKEIKKFNKTSDKYRIAAKDYSLYNKISEDSFTPGTSKLDNDLINGNIPDIILLDADMDVMSYLSKGFLTDLGSFIDNDPEIKRDDYYTNILDAYTYDNKLYGLPISFYIETLVSKTSMSSQYDKWTFDDFFSFADANSGIPVFDGEDRYSVMRSFITAYISDFVNFKDHSCSFDNESFVKLLEMINAYTAQDSEKGKYSPDYLCSLKNNASLISSYSNMNLPQYHQLVQYYAGEPVSVNGYPSASSGKNIVSAPFCFSVSENSKQKEGSWQFIRQFMIDGLQGGQYQYTDDNYTIKRSGVTSIIDQISADPESTSYAYTETDSVQIPPVNDEEINAYKQYLEKPAVSSLAYTKILKIITDETAGFFSSGCTAEEAAKAVQSKVNLYLNELL